MFKKVISYTDYNENAISETLYFNLTQNELVKLNVDNHGEFVNKIKEVESTNDPGDIYHLLMQLVELSYGVKSEDGKRFIKRDANGNSLFNTQFCDSAAYEALVDEFLSNPESAKEFIIGLVPPKVAKLAATNNNA